MPLKLRENAKIYINPFGNYTRNVLNDGLLRFGQTESPDCIETTSGKRIAQQVNKSFVEDFVRKGETDENLRYEIWVSYKNNKDFYFRGEMFFKRKKNVIKKKNFHARKIFKRIIP